MGINPTSAVAAVAGLSATTTTPTATSTSTSTTTTGNTSTTTTSTGGGGGGIEASSSVGGGAGGGGANTNHKNKIQGLVTWLADGEVDIKSVVDCAQELIGLYQAWEVYNEKACKEGIARFVKGRGLDK